MNACGADTLRDDARLMKELLDRNGYVRLRRLLQYRQLTPFCRVPNEYEEYAQLPHYFFAFPSTHLEALRKEYFEKTAKGIEWIING